MKPERQKRGAFRGALGLVTANWGLKLLALALALLIYHTLKPENGANHDINERTLFRH